MPRDSPDAGVPAAATFADPGVARLKLTRSPSRHRWPCPDGVGSWDIDRSPIASPTCEATGDSSRSTPRSTPGLEAAAIQRRVYEAGGPALLFTRVKGTAPSRCSATCSARSTATRFLFRDTLEAVRTLVELKVSPPVGLAPPLAIRGACRSRPCTCCRRRVRTGPILAHTTTLGSTPAARRPGPRTAGRSSRCRRSTARTPTGRGWRSRTWGCTGSRSRGTTTSRTARSACITRSTGGSASTTRRRSAGASRCGSTCSSAAPRP